MMISRELLQKQCQESQGRVRDILETILIYVNEDGSREMKARIHFSGPGWYYWCLTIHSEGRAPIYEMLELKSLSLFLQEAKRLGRVESTSISGGHYVVN